MTTRTAKQWERTLKIRHGVDTAAIRDTMDAARGVLVDANIDRIQSMLDASLQLYLVGEHVASMWAGQAAWEAATWVSYGVQDLRLQETKWKNAGRRKKRRKAQSVAKAKQGVSGNA